jgi:hypothetical protein
MYKDAIKIRKDVFLNGNIFTVKQENGSFLDDDDYDGVILAKNVLLNVSAILELAHTSNGDVPYSLEAALLSSAHIRVGSPAQNLSNFQMAPIPFLSVPTCSTSSPHDILKVSKKKIDHNLPVGQDKRDD